MTFVWRLPDLRKQRKEGLSSDQSAYLGVSTVGRVASVSPKVASLKPGGPGAIQRRSKDQHQRKIPSVRFELARNLGICQRGRALFTLFTTPSTTSPLNGLKTIARYRVMNSACPLPLRTIPLPISNIDTTAMI